MLLNLITVLIFGNDNRLLRSTLSNLLSLPSTGSLLEPNILLRLNKISATQIILFKIENKENSNQLQEIISYWINILA
jgi:hypothetical protein